MMEREITELFESQRKPRTWPGGRSIGPPVRFKKAKIQQARVKGTTLSKFVENSETL